MKSSFSSILTAFRVFACFLEIQIVAGFFFALAVTRFSSVCLAQDQPLFVATPLTAEGSFTDGVEGPACDAAGNIYAVNFATEQTIGKVSPNGKAEVFITLPNESNGNGIRFTRDGAMFIADYTAHNLLRVDMKTKAVSIFAHEESMFQPNDLALAPDGSFYLSDPDWEWDEAGQVWRVDAQGKVTKVAEKLGTPNGIDVSPDGRTLYVNETIAHGLWAFAILPDGSLAQKRLLVKFPDFSCDGMRCDVDGNLYLTRPGKGVVVKLSPTGEVLREIAVLGAFPTNICFGGPDGRTAYVTEAERMRIVQFRVDRPDLSGSALNRNEACPGLFFEDEDDSDGRLQLDSWRHY